MDIKIIINAILIIFILHIIILNLDFTVNFGNNKKNINESFIDSNKLDSYKKENESLDFLTSNANNDNFKQKMLNYMQQNKIIPETKFDKKNILPVAPANNYLTDNNQPNFESNVADISKFYNISYDNMNETDLKTTSLETLKNVEFDTSKENCDINPFVRQSKENPDNWEYKNELPMNGGSMNGIIGFDSLESQFSSYNGNKLNLQTADSNNFENIPHDDLRKPIVYAN